MQTALRTATATPVVDHTALQAVTRFLDDIAYDYVLAQVTGGAARMLQMDFAALHQSFQGCSNFYRLVFTLLCQGHEADDHYVRALLPSRAVEAFRAAGILSQDAQGRWSTSGRCVLAFEGVYTVADVPSWFPTSRRKDQPWYYGLWSFPLFNTYPQRLDGARVLDLYSGGVHALIGAARGAAEAMAVAADPTASDGAFLNGQLNGVDVRVATAPAGELGGIVDAQGWDLIVFGGPALPAAAEADGAMWEAAGADGLRVLRPVLDAIPRLLSARGTAIITCHSLGGDSAIPLNRDCLGPLAATHGLDIYAFISHKIPIETYSARMDGALARVRPQMRPLQRAEAVGSWREGLSAAGVPASYVYVQMLRLRRTGGAPGMHYVPTYLVGAADRLVRALGNDG